MLGLEGVEGIVKIFERIRQVSVRGWIVVAVVVCVVAVGAVWLVGVVRDRAERQAAVEAYQVAVAGFAADVDSAHARAKDAGGVIELCRGLADAPRQGSCESAAQIASAISDYSTDMSVVRFDLDMESSPVTDIEAATQRVGQARENLAGLTEALADRVGKAQAVIDGAQSAYKKSKLQPVMREASEVAVRARSEIEASDAAFPGLGVTKELATKTSELDAALSSAQERFTQIDYEEAQHLRTGLAGLSGEVSGLTLDLSAKRTATDTQGLFDRDQNAQ
ncbi:hypothetical protein [Actinobaculum suis]|uniref:hypothetical protein n=1 Tax=Actinobaculum suis TaxID=1657 RepID=UPI00163CA1A9|nr:hypothetical protein [Actinobaculum suis]